MIGIRLLRVNRWTEDLAEHVELAIDRGRRSLRSLLCDAFQAIPLELLNEHRSDLAKGLASEILFENCCDVSVVPPRSLVKFRPRQEHCVDKIGQFAHAGFTKVVSVFKDFSLELDLSLLGLPLGSSLGDDTAHSGVAWVREVVMLLLTSLSDCHSTLPEVAANDEGCMNATTIF